MGQAIVRFGELKVEQFVQGVNNNWLIYSQLPYSRQHSSGLDGDIIIGSTPTLEIIDVDLDVDIDPQYAFTYSIATDNKLKIAFRKTDFPSKAAAMDSLKCISVIYEIGNLAINGNSYIVVVRNSMGEEIHRTTPLSQAQAQVVISTFDDTRQMEIGGFLRYEMVRDFTVV